MIGSGRARRVLTPRAPQHSRASQNPDLYQFGDQPSLGASAGSTSRASYQNQAETPRFGFRFQASPDDTVHPSIEPNTNQTGTFSFGVPLPAQHRASSFIGSSSDTTTERFLTPVSASSPNLNKREDVETRSLDASIRDSRQATQNANLDLSELSSALHDMERAQRQRTSSPHLKPEPVASPSPSPSAHSRRASGRPRKEPHDVKDEAPPFDKFNDPVFQTAFKEAKNLMRNLETVLASSKLHGDPDSVMHRLYTDAQALARFQCPSTRVVGFVGDSGVGKSSLLNSLLDVRGLARTSNSGAACTCVVTEYRYHSDQGYAIEVERFSEQESATQLESLLKDYRHYHIHNRSLDAHEVKDLKERADLARDTFRAMFRGMLTNEDMLISASEAKVLLSFREWSNVRSSTVTNGRSLYPSADECSTRLMQLTSEDESSSSAAIWPWVKKIRVYANTHILSKGLVLVDLPGLRDLNAARRHITERYLLRCDEILVVCNEGRAITDEGVQAVVELAKKAELSNVGIVCTRSDDIDAEEAQKDWKGQKAKEIQRMLDAQNTANQALKKIEFGISTYDDVKNDDMSIEEKDELNSLYSSQRETRQRRDEQSFALKEFLITNRNANVGTQLLSSYKTKVPGDSLKVFCISNKIYWDKRGDPKDKAMRYLNLSGIIGLRGHCMALVSMSQHSAALKYMKTDISVLLGELSLWVQSGSGSRDVEEKEKIREVLATIEKRLKLELTGPMSKLATLARTHKQQFKTAISRYANGKMSDWGASAQDACDEWSGWHHASYSAFCRNYGYHSTGKVGTRNWNQEIIQKMASDLDAPWRQLCLSMVDHNDEATENAGKTFNWAFGFLDEKLGESNDTAESLVHTLQSHEDVLLADLQLIFDTCRQDLQTLRTDALSSIRSSNIGKAMQPAYEAARYESGPGSDARRKSIIRNAVYNFNLFPNLITAFERGFGEKADEMQGQVKDAITERLGDIRETFDIVRSENVALECERDDGFRERVGEAVAETMQEMGKIVGIVSGMVPGQSS